MGGNSVKGLVVMETIYPSENGSTVFEKDPKLMQQLAKEIKKGTIKIPAKSDETDVDEDLDAKVAGAVAEVWGYYDPKNLGSIPKKQCQKFFTDGLELYAIRKGIPSAKVIGQGVNKGKALDDCYARMSGTNPNTSRQQFESYIYTYDLDEALGPLLGTQGGQPVPSRLPANMMFDPTTLPKETGNVDLTKVKLRDYNSTMDG